jgi:hypothetical protein
MHDDSVPPQMTPLADGGLQAEWHDNGQGLEIVVPAGEQPTYYYFNRDTNEEEEDAFHANCARVQDLISRIG